MSPGGAVSRRETGALVRTRISGREQRPRPLRVTRTYQPRHVLPGHVRECVHNATRPRWWIYTWRRSGAFDVLRVPYQCNSWRCETCRVHESHVMYSRIQEAKRGLVPEGWTFWVLTLDQSRGRWRSAAHAFRELSTMTRKFLKRLRRWFRIPLRRWVATVEAHRSGMPHVNIMLHSVDIAHFIRSAQTERERKGHAGRNAILVDGELLRHARESGWGVQLTAECARSSDQVASYMVKIAGKGDQTAGELAKLSQLPCNAPVRFRRLRSAKGFLPRRRHNPEFTGTLVRRTTGPRGEPIVLPLHKVPECSRERVIEVCYSEEDRWIRELVTGDPGELVSRIVRQSRGPPIVAAT